MSATTMSPDKDYAFPFKDMYDDYLEKWDHQSV